LRIYQRDALIRDLQALGPKLILDAYDNDGVIHPVIKGFVRWVNPEPTVTDEKFALQLIGTLRETNAGRGLAP
jgi:hypothetical protein